MRHPDSRPARRVFALLLLACSLAAVAATPLRGTSTGAVTVVTGTVRDDAGHPLEHAQVLVMSLRVMRQTGPDGRYALSVQRTADVEPVMLLVRRIGYSERQVRVVLHGQQVQLDVTLVRDTMQLQEVVTTGAGADELQVRNDVRVPAVGRLGALSAQRRTMGGQPVASPAPLRVISDQPMRNGIRRAREPGNTESYDRIVENEFHSPRVAALSTFSVDVDRASYTNVRGYLSAGTLPPADAVRLEELVNYFPYDDPTPRAGDAPLRISTEVAPAPWNDRHDLVRIALRARDVDMRNAPPNNLVFLVDVSGSMNSPKRLPLVKQSLALLVEQMREQDRIAIVVYAGNAGLVLPSTTGADRQRILATLDHLEAGGSTAGGAGIRLAYDVARESFVRGGTNRVILCTDGDFNVGASSDGEMVRLIEQRRDEGSFLTILGFGMGNYKDSKLEKLSAAGNGNYGYIDDLLEARKMLVKEMGGTLLTVAKDVKLQVEFNPARVQAYRLLGYEDRMLQTEDFTNDAKDAGDVGAGHTVTALYEIVRAGVPLDVPLPGVAALRYQAPAAGVASDELLHVAMRYKVPSGGASQLVTHTVRAPRDGARPSESMRFASAVAGFGMLLRNSPNAGHLGWHDVITLADGARGADREGYRAEFVRLAEVAAQLSGTVAQRENHREHEPVRDYAVPAPREVRVGRP